MYGNKFTAAYGESPSQMWTVTIAGFKDFEIERGLRKLLFKGSGTPPTLPQFVSACKYSEEEDTPASTRLNAPRIASQYDEPIWCHGQKCLFTYLWISSRKYTEDELQELIQIKNKLVNDFRQVFAEDHSLTGGEIRDALFTAWAKV
jgi:hypothetical protein